MESIIGSVIPPKTKVLVIRNGAYGERMYEMANIYGCGGISYICPDNEIPYTDDVELILKNFNNISAIAMVHHETTTGILNPIKKIGALAKKYNKIFIVDAVSSFAGVPFDVNECNIDFIINNEYITGINLKIDGGL
jgi:2-aminoethylphosphonate-pyruvate transaminase